MGKLLTEKSCLVLVIVNFMDGNKCNEDFICQTSNTDFKFWLKKTNGVALRTMILFNLKPLKLVDVKLEFI